MYEGLDLWMGPCLGGDILPTQRSFQSTLLFEFGYNHLFLRASHVSRCVNDKVLHVRSTRAHTLEMYTWKMAHLKSSRRLPRNENYNVPESFAKYRHPHTTQSGRRYLQFVDWQWSFQCKLHLTVFLFLVCRAQCWASSTSLACVQIYSHMYTGSTVQSRLQTAS